MPTLSGSEDTKDGASIPLPTLNMPEATHTAKEAETLSQCGHNGSPWTKFSLGALLPTSRKGQPLSFMWTGDGRPKAGKLGG